MNKKYVELLVGLFMMIGLLSFVVLSFKVSGLDHYTQRSVYQVTADFDNVGGLKVRAPVRMAGVRVGEVGQIKLDPKTYRAHVVLLMDLRSVKIPIDSAASILTEGLLGANYVNLTPGFEMDMLKEGSRIEETHSALILENLISHFLFSLSKNGGDKAGSAVSSGSKKES